MRWGSGKVPVVAILTDSIICFYGGKVKGELFLLFRTSSILPTYSMFHCLIDSDILLSSMERIRNMVIRQLTQNRYDSLCKDLSRYGHTPPLCPHYMIPLTINDREYTL